VNDGVLEIAIRAPYSTAIFSALVGVFHHQVNHIQLSSPMAGGAPDMIHYQTP